MHRLVPVLAGTAVLAAVLAGCSSGSPSAPESSTAPVSSSTACSPTPSGTDSDAVTLSAKVGTDPKATFTAPLTVTTSQRTVATEGTGDLVSKGDTVRLEFSLYDGSSGKELTSTGFDGSNVQAYPLDDTLISGIVKTAACSTVGSRVVGVLSADDMFGSTGNESLGVAANTPIVIVIDIDGVVTPPEVEDFSTMKGMPSVTLASTNEPTITIPKSDPPSETRIGLIKEGTGEVVPAGATVHVDYRGVIWRTGKEFDSSWSRGSASQFVTNQVVKGFQWAIEGQKVGSTLITVIAPGDGYGSGGNSSAGIKGTDTIVFVLTIESID